MPLSWFFFACLSVLGSLFYNIAVKNAGDHINAFVFTVVITAIALLGHLACLAAYKTYFGEAVTLQADKSGLWMAALAGLGIVLVDLGFFFAVRLGGLMPSTGFWVIGSLTITTILSYFIFNETLTLNKLAGAVLGATALFLLTRP